jgi:kynurenine formamidase
MATDFIATPVHGNSQTHLDAPCHVAYRGQLYNGVPGDTVDLAGARALSIMVYTTGIVGRGVLLDIPRLRGLEWLEPGDAVTAEELIAAEDAEGVELGEGDIMVFRTGHHRRRVDLGPWDSSDVGGGRAGLDIAAVDLLHDRHVAAFLPDGDGETIPSPVAGVSRPIHALQLSAMGMAACDNLDLEALAKACAQRKRYEFLAVMCPLGISGGTGSPLNPVAIL